MRAWEEENRERKSIDASRERKRLPDESDVSELLLLAKRSEELWIGQSRLSTHQQVKPRAILRA